RPPATPGALQGGRSGGRLRTRRGPRAPRGRPRRSRGGPYPPPGDRTRLQLRGGARRGGVRARLRDELRPLALHPVDALELRVIALVFSYEVVRDAAEFERVYGMEGEWAEFFRQGRGYIGTELL